MSDTNRFEPPAEVDPSAESCAAREPQSFLEAMAQGVRLGLKWSTYIMGPIAAILLWIVVEIIFFQFLFVEGTAILTDPKLRWKALEMLATPFAFYLSCCLWGVVAGELVCPLLYLVKRTRSRHIEARTDDGHAN